MIYTHRPAYETLALGAAEGPFLFSYAEIRAQEFVVARRAAVVAHQAAYGA